MGNIPDHQRDPWAKMHRARRERPEGGLWTLLLLAFFFTLLGAFGVFILVNPRSIPFYFPIIGGILRPVAGILVALFLLWASVTGLKFTFQEWRRRP
jgi:protein-S-isoprenylcysteine O-methyltransferase Ste14